MFQHTQIVRGAHAPSRAGDGALAIANFIPVAKLTSPRSRTKFVSARRRNRHAGARALPRKVLAIGLYLLWMAQGLRAGLGNDNPNGPTGDYNGSITTAGYYDPFTGNGKRAIDDIVVPGSVGAYPLKWTRYLNTRGAYWPDIFGQGGAWTHSYSWGLGIWPQLPPEYEPGPEGRIRYPDGRTMDLREAGGGFYLPIVSGLDQVHEYVLKTGGGNYGLGNYDLLLGDGGKVQFRPLTGVGLVPRFIVDPYGLTTTLTYLSGRLDKITEPGGRYLKINYTTRTFTDDWGYVHTYHLISSVQAFDGPQGHLIETVNYTYTQGQVGTMYGPLTVYDLTGVDYSDGTHATYTYQPANVVENPNAVPWRLVSTCDDVRYNGPMGKIKYEYVGPNQVAGGASWGQVKAEKNKATGEIVSQVTYPPVGQPPNTDAYYRRTETRGGGQTRDFQYSRGGSSPELIRYTDFQGHSTNIAFSFPNGVIRKSITDARGNITHTDRGGMGLITKITYPGGAYVEYTYSNTRYLATSRDERGKVTSHIRDGNNRIIRTNYPDGAYETFTYNNFGQVLTHRLKNEKYQHFQYDTRGLLTAKWNPTANSTPVGGDPKTTYTYYTSGPWTDRVQTETDPLGHNTTYEYDRNANGAAVAGRGLVTKIIHHDGKYQAFGYDPYGNKLWEENELRKRTTYTYDSYNRLLTAKNPLNKTTTYSYELTNGNQNLSGTLHTTASVHLVTIPGPPAVTTENRYDANFRKISTKQAYGTELAATTTFTYDAVGNLTWVTDPLIHKTFNQYDVRNRKISSTEAHGTAVATTTTWSYDAASNVTIIGRPDGRQQWKTYDALNRVLTDRVQRQAIGNPTPPPLNLTTRFVYNPSGTIQKVTDPKGQWTTFEYDPSDRKTKMTYHGGAQYQSWTYDAAGNLTSRRTVSGKTQNFTYDTRNRKITMTWSNGAEWAYFGYDDASRLIRALNGTGTWNTNIISDVVRTYDDAGHLTSDQQNVNGLGTKNVTYPWYDDDGKLKRIYLAGGGYDYTFSYDLMGRFEKISPTGSGTAFQYYYNAASNEIQRHNSLSNPETDQFYSRDSLNRMSARFATRSSGPAPTFSAEFYTYDRMSRLTVVTRAEDGKRDQFGYYWDGDMMWTQYGVTGDMPEGEPDPDQDMPDATDPWSQWAGDAEAEGIEPPPLQEEAPPPLMVTEPDVAMDRWVSYFLDNASNRTRVVETGVHKLYTPNNFNQYTQGHGEAVSNGTEHEVSSYRNISYTYINDERLSRVGTTGLNYWLYYDALGRCVKRILNGATTYYIYDGEKPVLEYNSSGAIVARNVYGKWIDEILMRTDTTVNGGQPFYYHQDRNENVTHLTNAAGAVIEKYKYDAFGAVTIYAPNNTERATSVYKNRFLFTGREYAPSALGFYEYRARAYNPTLGRFMSEDPKGFDAGDYNLFRYCHNDPLDLTDPMGLWEWSDVGEAAYSFFTAGGRATFDAQPIIGNTTGRYAVEQGKLAKEQYGNNPNAGEAVRHEVWQAELRRKYGEYNARKIGDAHEKFKSKDAQDAKRDQYNNELGRENGKASKSREDSLQSAKRDWEGGRAAKDKNDPKIDKARESSQERAPDANRLEPPKVDPKQLQPDPLKHQNGF
jgi:RHS repeat-associated protein